MTAESMHLMFIAPTAYPLGGVAVWLDYLMRGLVRQGVKVTLGAVAGDHHNVDQYLEHYPFGEVVQINYGSGSQYSRTQAIISAVERIAPTAVVCVSIPDVYLATRSLRAQGRGHYHLLATVHALMPNLMQDLSEYHDVIDLVMVSNELTRLMVLECTPLQSDKVYYAPYGVDLPAQVSKTSSGNIKATTRGTCHERLTVLYCGRIDNMQKRCQDLALIIRGLHQAEIDCELIIAGDGPYKAELLSNMAGLNVRDLGALRADQVAAKAYKHADALLLTSEWETGPIVAWEAMANGVPVICSRYRGLEAEGALRHMANCFVFDIGDIGSAVKGLTELCDPTLRDRLVRGGFELVQARYTKSVSVEKWGQGFSEIHHREYRHTNPKPVEFPYRGRLERLVGHRFAELLRRISGRKAPINSAGDEWPNTHSCPDSVFSVQFASLIQTIESRATTAGRK